MITRFLNCLFQPPFHWSCGKKIQVSPPFHLALRISLLGVRLLHRPPGLATHDAQHLGCRHKSCRRCPMSNYNKVGALVRHVGRFEVIQAFPRAFCGPASARCASRRPGGAWCIDDDPGNEYFDSSGLGRDAVLIDDDAACRSRILGLFPCATPNPRWPRASASRSSSSTTPATHRRVVKSFVVA